MRELTDIEVKLVSGGDDSLPPNTTVGASGKPNTCPAGTIPVSAGGYITVTAPGGESYSFYGTLDTCIP